MIQHRYTVTVNPNIISLVFPMYIHYGQYVIKYMLHCMIDASVCMNINIVHNKILTFKVFIELRYMACARVDLAI